MFSRQGTLRETDTDGEDDPPIIAIPERQPLTNENGITITDEHGDPILI